MQCMNKRNNDIDLAQICGHLHNYSICSEIAAFHNQNHISVHLSPVLYYYSTLYVLLVYNVYS